MRDWDVIDSREKDDQYVPPSERSPEKGKELVLVDSQGYKKDIRDKSKFKEFNKFLGFSTASMEKEIAIFFQKLQIKEKIHRKEILERTLFERELK